MSLYIQHQNRKHWWTFTVKNAQLTQKAIAQCLFLIIWGVQILFISIKPQGGIGHTNLNIRNPAECFSSNMPLQGPQLPPSLIHLRKGPARIWHATLHRFIKNESCSSISYRMIYNFNRASYLKWKSTRRLGFHLVLFLIFLQNAENTLLICTYYQVWWIKTSFMTYTVR